MPAGEREREREEEEGAERDDKPDEVNRATNVPSRGAPIPPDQLMSTASEEGYNPSSDTVYSGTYGRMRLVPEAMYNTMMKGSKDLIQNLHQNQIKKHVDAAKSGANNVAEYRCYCVKSTY